jgi:hypothetical protein
VGVLDQVPILYVAIEGEAAPVDFTRRVFALTVEEHVKKATKISLVIEDGDETICNGDVLREGMTIGVRWGYVGALSPPRGGIVHKIEPDYDNHIVTIEAMGRELELSHGPIRRAFQGRTFRQAVEAVGSDAGVTVQWDAQAGQVALDAQIIHDEHAWRWLLRHTAELGLEIDHDGSTLTIRDPALSERAHLVLHYKWRNAEILKFTPETNTHRHRREDEGVVALFFDPGSAQNLSHAAGDASTTRASLASRRLQQEARRQAQQRQQAAEDTGRQAYVQEHPELQGQSREEQQQAYDQSRTQAATSGQEVTEDDSSLLVNLGSAGEESTAPASPGSGDGASGGGTGSAGGAGGGAQSQGRVVPVVTAADESAARQHLREVAEGRQREHERQRARAKCTCVGLPTARRGRVVQIVGVAARDAGLWYCKGVTHKIDEGGYETELELTRDGVNGAHGRRQGAGAQPNTTATQPAAQTNSDGAAQQERPANVNLLTGEES